MDMVGREVPSRPDRLGQGANIVGRGADIRPVMGYFVAMLSDDLRFVRKTVFSEEDAVDADYREVTGIDQRDGVVHAVDDRLGQLVGAFQPVLCLLALEQGGLEGRDRPQVPSNEHGQHQQGGGEPQGMPEPPGRPSKALNSRRSARTIRKRDR